MVSGKFGNWLIVIKALYTNFLLFSGNHMKHKKNVGDMWSTVFVVLLFVNFYILLLPDTYLFLQHSVFYENWAPQFYLVREVQNIKTMYYSFQYFVPVVNTKSSWRYRLVSPFHIWLANSQWRWTELWYSCHFVWCCDSGNRGLVRGNSYSMEKICN